MRGPWLPVGRRAGVPAWGDAGWSGRLAGWLAGWLVAAVVTGVAATAADLPVGYDHPESDRGGPRLADGPAWFDRAMPNPLVLARRLAGGRLTVLLLGNFAAPAVAYDLGRRLDADFVVVAPESGNILPGREVFMHALQSRPRFDVIALSRVAEKSIPPDVQYEILSRVKDDGVGLLVVDLFDRSETFNPEFLQLKPEQRGADWIPGVPYAALQQWATSRETRFTALNYWNTNGVLRSEPQLKPFRYADVSRSVFGRGTVLWVSTGTHWERHYGGWPLLPLVGLHPDDRTTLDYLYSHTAKALRMAAGRRVAAHVEAASFVPGPAGAQTVTVKLTADPSWSGLLRWQVRTPQAAVVGSGTQPVQVTPPGAEVAVAAVVLRDAGRQFVDVWLETAEGETVDWGSGALDLDRGVASPVVEPDQPGGVPRGAALAGRVRLPQVPGGVRVRVRLTDRHGRLVGRLEQAAAESVPWSFPSTGLDGSIWRVDADVVAAAGTVLARGTAHVTSPYTRAERGGFYPLVTTSVEATPFGAARREYLRQLGFLGIRPYGAGDPVAAEAAAWSDLQLFPFPIRVTAPASDFGADHLTDWEDPAVQTELAAVTQTIARGLAPFGGRGLNLTDDSEPGHELPPAAYTTIAFHDWLKREYGDFAAVCAAWDWQPEAEPTPPGELPHDPYVTRRFHQWLAARYGDLAGVAKAWQLPQAGFGSLHTFGSIQRDMVLALQAKGKAGPAEDVRRFLAEVPDAIRHGDPFGAVHAASVKRAYEAGRTAPWVDAQRFLQHAWVDEMARIADAARTVLPEAAVGTDAAFYGAAMSEAFGRLDYLAPYYDDRAVKVAVSRGRMRRAGDFGACLGAYGEKPANVSGRRSQIWDVLFAGGNGFYYWMFSAGTGMAEDLTLSDRHARYQCEVVEELMGGIAELFTAAERVFDAVAVLDSQASAVCDPLLEKLEPVTTQGNSLAAFQSALEDAGLNPHTITADELAAGWLAEHGVRLLALPGAACLGDREVAAVEAFVQAGGVVVADVLPGVRQPNGRLRQTVPLAALFGVAFDAQGQARRVRGPLLGTTAAADSAALDYGETLADPRVTAGAARTTGRVDTAAALFDSPSGQGRAFLFNASFATYATTRTAAGPAWAAWQRTFAEVVRAAGLRPLFSWTSQGRATPGFELSPFRNGRGYLLGIEDLGGGDFAGRRRPVEVRLPPGVWRVYDVRAGSYVGSAPVLKTEIPRNGHRAYALLPYRVKRLELSADAKPARLGQTVTVAVDVVTDAKAGRDLHVVRLEVTAPGGDAFLPFRRVVRLPPGGPARIPLTFAYDDPAGSWGLRATDMATGETASLRLAVQKEAAP